MEQEFHPAGGGLTRTIATEDSSGLGRGGMELLLLAVRLVELKLLAF